MNLGKNVIIRGATWRGAAVVAAAAAEVGNHRHAENKAEGRYVDTITNFDASFLPSYWMMMMMMMMMMDG